MPSDSGDLYVGYLPVPAGYRRFLRWVVPVIAGAFAVVAGLAAWSQPDPGPGAWDADVVRTFAGVAVARPYPMLWADDRGDGRPGFILLAEAGKSGGRRVGAFDGRRIRVSGTLLHRSAQLMLELAPGAPVATIPSESPAPVPLPMAGGAVTLRGEIVDGKCFLGAMKPGRGKTHKECAILCISGGIPALFVTRDAHGAEHLYLLSDETGGPLGSDALPFVADPVEVSGQIEQRGELVVIRVAASAIRRL